MHNYLDRNRRWPGLQLLVGRRAVRAHEAIGHEGQR
jgi:hypothetical protein